MSEKENFYQTSTDYERLYELLSQGNKVVCFVDYITWDGGKRTISGRDVCFARAEKNRVRFVGRGIEYGEHRAGKESFTADCKRSNVEFIDCQPTFICDHCDEHFQKEVEGKLECPVCGMGTFRIEGK